MQFLVPQFIERNPKIFGPFTFKQFVVIGGAITVSIGLFFVLPYNTFIIAALAIIGGSVLFVFLRVGKESFPTYLKNFIVFSTTPKVYVWKQKSQMPVTSSGSGSRLSRLNIFVKTKKK